MVHNCSGRGRRCIETSILPRRRLLCLGICAGLLPAVQGRAEDTTSWAAAFIRRVGNQIAAITAAPGPPETRQLHLAALINEVVDVPGAARFCLGRYWQQATAQQQQAYVTLFHSALMRAILGHISTEQHKDAAIQVNVEHSALREDSIIVPTVIERAGTPPFKVIWVVNTDAANPRIVDVIAEGTSLRLTIRSDYAAFLHQHNESVDALLEALRQQTCENCATAAAGAR